MAHYYRRFSEEITLLAGQLNAGTYRLLKLIAEFDDRKAWSGGGTVRSCVHWLNWKCGIAIGAAREKVRVAHCLQELPLIDAAFASGEISYSKVRAMTRVATPDNEDYLLMIAQHGTASHMEQVVAKYRNVQRSSADSAERGQRDARNLLYYQDDDGMWVIHARLSAEEGALVVKAIEAVVEPIQAETRRRVLEEKALSPEQETPEESGRQQEEKNSAEIFASEVAVVDEGPDTQTPDSRGQIRADALVAMAMRDKTCRFPGCCESNYVDAHHIEHWADGGETDLDNLATLCRHHHAQLHRECFEIRVEPSSTTGEKPQLVFVTPSGKTIESDLFPQFPSQVAETAEEALRHAAPRVSAKTCVTRWQGESCDYGMAINGLLQLDGNLRVKLDADHGGCIQPQ